MKAFRPRVAPLSSETGTNHPVKPRPSKALASPVQLGENDADDTALISQEFI